MNNDLLYHNKVYQGHIIIKKTKTVLLPDNNFIILQNSKKTAPARGLYIYPKGAPTRRWASFYNCDACYESLIGLIFLIRQIIILHVNHKHFIEIRGEKNVQNANSKSLVSVKVRGPPVFYMAIGGLKSSYCTFWRCLR